MAGYSGTPLPKKLGIKDGHHVAFLNAPDDFESLLDPMPAVTIARSLRGTAPFDVVVFFTKRRADLEKKFSTIAERLRPAGGLWVAWPKRASKVPTDMTEDVVREVGLPTGLVDNKVCAINEIWSGLRLVYRRENRPRSPKAQR